MDELLRQYLGDKTRQKLREIMQGCGSYWRNQAREADGRLRTLALFAEVWGAGQKTAGGLGQRRWA